MYTPEIYRYQKISISQFRPGTSFGPKISWLVTILLHYLLPLRRSEFAKLVFVFGSTERYWVGASDVLNEREWKWMTSKTALSITHWHAGEPNNDYDGNENCMEINNDGGWNDAECRILLKYICEMENR